MVAQVLQFPQVVGTDEGGHAPSGYLVGDELPGCQTDHRVQTVKRLITEQIFRPCQDQGCLPPHTLGKSRELLIRQQRKGSQQTAVFFLIPAGVTGPVKGCHFRKGGSRKEPQVIGDQYNPGFGRDMVENGMVVQQGFSRTGTVNAGKSPQQRGFACTVGSHQSIDTAGLDLQ